MKSRITRNHISMLRGMTRMSREEFAKKVGVSPELIKKIEYEDRRVTPRTESMVKKAFGLTPEEITQLGEIGRRYGE